MKKITLLISALVLSVGLTFAQNNRTPGPYINSGPSATTTNTSTEKCATMDLVTEQELSNMEDWIAPRVAAYIEAQANGGTPEAIYNIPVIVHIIHNSTEAVGVGRNVSNARVQQQIDRLNADFRLTNTDAGNASAAFQAVQADVEVNFCLITIYPTGHPQVGQTLTETGVNRVDATTIGLSNTTSGYSTTQINNTIKPATSMDPNEVMNFWVCQMSGGLLGFAQFPNSGASNTDGIVVTYTAFGNTSGPYNLGRTATHEVGHYLNLFHIWGDDGGACSGSDQVSDTPNQGNSSFGCPSGVQTDGCVGAPNGYMYQNYMDYTNDACMVMFTAGQKARVQAILNASTGANRRRTLNAASLTLCAPPALTAQFTESATTIVAGNTITFTDASVGPNTITNWAWDFDIATVGGVAPATGNTQGPHVITYNTPGTFGVSLMVTDNTAANDTETKTLYITVLPAGTIICDSTAASWDWTTEAYGAAYWGPDCNGTNPSGFIMGNNCYDDNGWAVKVPFSQAGKELTDVLYVFVQSIGNGAAALKVWDDDGAGGSPNTILYQTATTTGAYSGNLNAFIAMPVSPAVPLTGDFFIGYDHNATPVTGDSLCMGVAAGTIGNQTWANETGGWLDLVTYGVDYKGTVIAVICDIATGEKELVGNINEISVFPNPSVGTINVALTDKVKTTVSVFNMLGEEIYVSTENTQLFTVDMNNQPNGVYFVKIKSGDSITTKKVILSK